MTLTPQLVDCLIEDPRWGATGLEEWAEDSARAALGATGLSPDGFEISLLACDDARIAELNRAFRGKARPTNVLSWPAQTRAPAQPGDAPPRPAPAGPGQQAELGDIALAYDTCAREAEAARLSLETHGRHLVVHGVLHLLGYDHETDPDALLMERLEVGILAQMGIADPYAAGTDRAMSDKADRTDG